MGKLGLVLIGGAMLSKSLIQFSVVKWSCVPSLLLAAATAKSLQSCPTLCEHRDGSPPGSPIPGILQARTLEWVAISFSNAWKWKVKVKPLSHVQLLATPWIEAYQAPLSMGFARQEYWSGLPPEAKLWCQEPPSVVHQALCPSDLVP